MPPNMLSETPRDPTYSTHTRARVERDTSPQRIFNHLLRGEESVVEKWNYVRDNPMRAVLVTNADD
jgi:hypothetical protein